MYYPKWAFIFNSDYFGAKGKISKGESGKTDSQEGRKTRGTQVTPSIPPSPWPLGTRQPWSCLAALSSLMSAVLVESPWPKVLLSLELFLVFTQVTRWHGPPILGGERAVLYLSSFWRESWKIMFCGNREFCSDIAHAGETKPCISIDNWVNYSVSSCQ